MKRKLSRNGRIFRLFTALNHKYRKNKCLKFALKFRIVPGIVLFHICADWCYDFMTP